MSIRRQAFAAVVFGVAAINSVASAADATTQRYDVRDLLNAVPDYSSAEAAAAAKAPDPVARDKQLAAAGEAFAGVVYGALPTNVAVTFDAKSNQVVVTAGSDAQPVAKRVIAQVRADRTRLITTTARVVQADDAALAALPDALRLRLAAAAFDAGRHPAELDDADAKRLVDTLKAGTTTTALSTVPFAARNTFTEISMPRLTTFNGQKAFAAVTTSTNYVESVDRVESADGSSVSFVPNVAEFESGVKADVRARTAADGASVAVELKLSLTQLLTLDTVAQEKDVVIQKPRSRVDRFDGLYLVPAGKTLLIRPAGVADEKGTHVLVLLKSTAAALPPGE